MSIVIGVIAGFVAAYFSFRIFFDDYEDFIECVKFWFTPDWISFFREEYFKDLKSELRIWFWVIISFIPGYSVYFLLNLM